MKKGMTRSMYVARDGEAIGALLRRVGWRMGLLFSGILLALWGFAELADEVHELEAFVFDEPILLHTRLYAGPVLDRGFVVLSWLGYQGVIVFDVALTLLLAARRRWREASFVALACMGSALLNLGGKQWFRRDRPSLWESIAPEATFSFPSGHAMGSMTLALVVLLLARRTRWRWPVATVALLFALSVGYSRIYLGVHYPSDILGGWTAASAWCLGVYALLFRGGHRPWKRAPH